MGVVDGLSATIAQHNPEVDFQTVWASDGEEAKLDIYYREAITDLESYLARFSSATAKQFDLQRLADDLTISFNTLSHWPPRLTGVLTNLIQNYLVHAITAGWLNDFPDIKTSDYAGMGASDLEAIKGILLEKNFSFAEAERNADDKKKTGSNGYALLRGRDDAKKEINAHDGAGRTQDAAGKAKADYTAEGRGTDSEDKGILGVSAGVRSADAEAKVENQDEAVGRSSDAEAKIENLDEAGVRSSDAEDKDDHSVAAEARNGDEVEKMAGGGANGSERNRDFMSQHFHHDRVDWSGGRPPFELR